MGVRAGAERAIGICGPDIAADARGSRQACVNVCAQFPFQPAAQHHLTT